MDQGNYSSIGVPKKLNFLLKNLYEKKQLETFKCRKSKPKGIFIYGWSEFQKNLQKHYKKKMLKELKFQLNNLNLFYGR